MNKCSIAKCPTNHSGLKSEKFVIYGSRRLPIPGNLAQERVGKIQNSYHFKFSALYFLVWKIKEHSIFKILYPIFLYTPIFTIRKKITRAPPPAPPPEINVFIALFFYF